MTIILKRSDIVPAEVSAGLDTVAVRMPSHPVAQAIIKAAQTPLAAPSANISGSPSPTCFKYVYDDMNGKIAAIVDGGECGVGVESTVIDLTGETPNLLRPGGITYEQLKDVLGDVNIDKGVLDKINDNEKVSSPGMKYKHYAPKAEIVIVDADSDSYCTYVNSQNGAYALCFEEDKPKLKVPSVCYGNEQDDISQAKELFTALRRLDEIGAKRVYARMPKRNGVGLAVYNRLIRAAAFQVVKP